MNYFPKDALERLEFDKILNFSATYCYGKLGKESVLDIKPINNLAAIQKLLDQVTQAKTIIEQGESIPIGQYDSIENFVDQLQIEGYVLEHSDVLVIMNILEISKQIYIFFNEIRRKVYPRLFEILENKPYEPLVLNAINRVFDSEGLVKADASDELLKIRKRITSKFHAVEKQFRFACNLYKGQGYLSDTLESVRNGRRVLCVMAEHKRKIKGIMHDESATGKMAYIEPNEVIELGNDLFDLQQEERREIYKIVKELCNFLRNNVDFITSQQSLLVKFDVINAKAKLAIQYNGIQPFVFYKPKFNLKQVRHPLLMMKNKLIKKETVPFDLELSNDDRLLVISGPNAGGKSILMKSVGLLQIMLQSGFLLPITKGSEIGIFEKICVDIGDQQGIEDDLSTYSSKLRNMKQFLDVSDDKTLVIIDEFGSGTDPKIGGAIAEAILRELHIKHSFGIITTHYGNLKVFTFKTPGIVNGAMHFDKESLSPTYTYIQGRPGSSYGFEIAHKTGFPAEVLTYAQSLVSSGERAIDIILVDLQTELKELHDKAKEVKNKENQLENLIKSYQSLHKDLELNRKKFKLEQREKMLQQQFQDGKALDKLLKELKAEKNISKIAQIKNEVNKVKNSIQTEVSSLESQIINDLAKDTFKKQIEVGDLVRIKTGGAAGTVIGIEKNKAQVQLGEMIVLVKLIDLTSVDPMSINQIRTSPATDLIKQASVETKIDLRGMRMSEAIKALEVFVDNALINNIQHLRIVHGKGDGILKKAVNKKLKEYKDVNTVSHPEEEFGGTGITLVSL